MENATKALLIAAAILVAILIISLALVVYNMASQTVNSVNLSEAEITSFNSKFQQYEGTNVTGANVKALLRTIENNNAVNANDGKEVKVKYTAKEGSTSTSVALTNDATSVSAQIVSGGRYEVKCSTADNGLVNQVTITEK